MLEIQVDTGSARRLLDALGKLPKGLKREVADAVRRSAQDVARDARSLIRSKAARRRKAGGSTPGEPPVSRSGDLAKSIKSVRARRDGMAYKVQSSYVGRFLEVGTSRGVLARPFIGEIVSAIERTLAQVSAS
jgi:hypothetical protein